MLLTRTEQLKELKAGDFVSERSEKLTELELDAAKIRQVLINLIRNAIVHGLETPAERHAAGKPETGELVVDVKPEGNEIVIVISDDGAGLNKETIYRKALEKKLIQPTFIYDFPASVSPLSSGSSRRSPWREPA